MAAKVLVIGELLIDMISTDFVDDLSQAKKFDVFPGGSPANFCRFLNALQVQTRLIASVGNDGMGKILLADLEKKKIDISNINIVEGKSTSIILVARSKGTPDFMPYRDADLYLKNVDEVLIADAEIIHTSAFALSMNPAQNIILDAFSRAFDQNKLISIDWNYADKIWGKDNNAHHVLSTICQYKPLLKMSMDDVNRFTNKQLNIAEAKSFLEGLNTKVCCLTCGAEGVWYKSDLTNWQFEAATQVEVVDATGAGDSFWAGFICEYLKAQNLTDSVKNGIAIAAKKIQGKLAF